MSNKKPNKPITKAWSYDSTGDDEPIPLPLPKILKPIYSPPPILSPPPIIEPMNRDISPRRAWSDGVVGIMGKPAPVKMPPRTPIPLMNELADNRKGTVAYYKNAYSKKISSNMPWLSSHDPESYLSGTPSTPGVVVGTTDTGRLERFKEMFKNVPPLNTKKNRGGKSKKNATKKKKYKNKNKNKKAPSKKNKKCKYNSTPTSKAISKKNSK